MNRQTGHVVGQCPACGKNMYRTRREARNSRKRNPREKINAYPCGDYWHVGHLPPNVRAGIVGREVLRRKSA